MLVHASMVVVDALERLVQVAAQIDIWRRLVIREAQEVALVHAQVDAVEPVAYLLERCVLLVRARIAHERDVAQERGDKRERRRVRITAAFVQLDLVRDAFERLVAREVLLLEAFVKVEIR